MRGDPRGALAAATLAVVGVLAACGGSSKPAPPPVTAAPRPSPPPSPTPKPTPKRPSHPPYQYLSGRPWVPNRPVVAVKIDNVAQARPQVGVSEADLVYVEQVEYGLTRLMAVYSSRLPTEIGPVRSARTNDIELLSEFGRPVLAFSGANAGVAADVRRANVVDASADLVTAPYFRDGSREIPHNLFLSPGTLLGGALTGQKRGTPAKDIGLRFGAARPGGRAIHAETVRFPAATFGFTWDAPHHGWAVSLDGSPDRLANGVRLTPPNVILQYVKVHNDKYVDVNGNVSLYSITTGTGRGVLLRGGRSTPLTWQRIHRLDGTRFLAGGKDLTLAPGQTWIVLVPDGTPLLTG